MQLLLALASELARGKMMAESSGDPRGPSVVLVLDAVAVVVESISNLKKMMQCMQRIRMNDCSKFSNIRNLWSLYLPSTFLKVLQNTSMAMHLLFLLCCVGKAHLFTIQNSKFKQVSAVFVN